MGVAAAARVLVARGERGLAFAAYLGRYVYTPFSFSAIWPAKTTPCPGEEVVGFASVAIVAGAGAPK